MEYRKAENNIRSSVGANDEQKKQSRSLRSEAMQERSRTGQLQPTDRIRAAFASALASLREDIGGQLDDIEINASLKAKIRNILEEEMTEKQQANSLLNAASALTSLGDGNSATAANDSKPEESAHAVNVYPGDCSAGKSCSSKKKSFEGEEKKKSDATAKKAPAPREDVPLTFPQKLMEILEDRDNDHIITWLPHGRAFIIYQKKKFAAEILPRCFKESKFTSFTRKLNRWGFVRVTKGPEIGAYYHKFFQRGNYVLCMQMCCQSMNKSRQQLPDNFGSIPLQGTSLQERALLMGGPMVYSSPVLASPSLAAISNGNLGSDFPAQPGVATSYGGVGVGAVDVLSQQLQLFKMTRSQNAPQLSAQDVFSSTRSGPERYSSAVVQAALEALQRSYQRGADDCGKPVASMTKSALPFSSPLQQQIDQYHRLGRMDPALMQAIVSQQMAAAAMGRAQQARSAAQGRSQLPQQKLGPPRRNPRAHAA